MDVSSLFQGTSKNESRIHVDATVYLDFITQCEGLLTLSDVRLSEDASGDDHKNNQEFYDALTEFNLRFAFTDGIITEICPGDEEKSWVLNFKKGVLSMIQNSMRRFDLDYETEELDVRGLCKTSYRVRGPKGTSLLIEKEKNLMSCKGRTKLHSFVQSTPYKFKPVSRSLIFNSLRSVVWTGTMRKTDESKTTSQHSVNRGVAVREGTITVSPRERKQSIWMRIHIYIVVPFRKSRYFCG